MNINLWNQQKVEKSSLKIQKLIYEKLFRPKEIDKKSEETELLKLIEVAKAEWDTAVKNFDAAKGDEIIEYYIYNIKACEVKYDFLITEAKKVGLKAY